MIISCVGKFFGTHMLVVIYKYMPFELFKPLMITIKSPKWGTNSSCLKASPMFATSNSYVNDLRIKLMRDAMLLYFGPKQFEKIFNSTKSLES